MLPLFFIAEESLLQLVTNVAIMYGRIHWKRPHKNIKLGYLLGYSVRKEPRRPLK